MIEHVTLRGQDAHASQGTCLKGAIVATYPKLVATFGEPTYPHGDGDRSDCEWVLLIDGVTVATIYNWKNGPRLVRPERPRRRQPDPLDDRRPHDARCRPGAAGLERADREARHEHRRLRPPPRRARLTASQDGG
jgi:hypothetical protein